MTLYLDNVILYRCYVEIMDWETITVSSTVIAYVQQAQDL